MDRALKDLEDQQNSKKESVRCIASYLIITISR